MNHPLIIWQGRKKAGFVRRIFLAPRQRKLRKQSLVSLLMTDSFSASNSLNEDSMNSEERAFNDQRQKSLHNQSSSLSQSESTQRNGFDDILERLKRAELEALKAKVMQRRAEADKEEILKHVREAEKKCLKEVELITRTFICRLNEANDRASDASQSRYIAEEAKRLAEEQFTLYKYESEKTIHEIKTMLEETMLERDELSESLRSFDEDVQCRTPTRKYSLGELDKKYQRYISTSDRTIQNMKSQLDEVTQQRDTITEQRNLSKKEVRETRDVLEQVVKEKDDLAFRLDESNCEVEKLEETISRMVHKRQKAERERDQLQILTDMSLMKLRQAEKPKKRHSVGSVTYEKKDNNLRRLSMQLMNLRTPTKQRRQSADTIYEVAEFSSSDEAAFPSRNGSEDERRSPSPKSAKRRPKEPDSPVSSQANLTDLRCSTPKDSEEDLMLNNIASSGYIVNMQQTREVNSEQLFDTENEKTNEQNHEHFDDQMNDDNQGCNRNDDSGCHSNSNQGYNSKSDSSNYDNSNYDNDNHRQLSAQNSLPFPIPTLLVDQFREVDTTTNKENNQSIPDIEISLVDDHQYFTGNGYFSEHETTNERVFVVPFNNGDTSMVYSFDSDGGANKGVPQTVL